MTAELGGFLGTGRTEVSRNDGGQAFASAFSYASSREA
jgi:hypothetical protein